MSNKSTCLLQTTVSRQPSATPASYLKEVSVISRRRVGAMAADGNFDDYIGIILRFMGYVKINSTAIFAHCRGVKETAAVFP